MKFAKALKLVGIAEGGYSNHPNDTGGETVAGIARNKNPNWTGWKYVDKWKESGLNINQINKLAKTDPQFLSLVEALYRGQYWNTANCDLLPEKLRYPVFSCSVNCGHVWATKLLQRAAGTTADGIFGRMTRTACWAIPADELCEKFYKTWQAYYQAIVKNNPSQSVFLKGWLARIENVKKDND